MISTLRKGNYKLVETKHNVKILYLDNDTYAWPQNTKYGDMLVLSHRIPRGDSILGMGHYHLYAVEDEPAISDNIHLELEAGQGVWQGYLLLTGLPDSHKLRSRIIPTREVITGNPRYRFRNDLNKVLAHNK